MFISLSANILLFVAQLTAALLSGSLTLFATTLDAFMDLASIFVLIFAGKLAASSNIHKYPTGRTKYKTAGIIVFATLMATLSLQIWSESIQSFVKGSRDVNVGFVSIVIVGSGIAVKLFLFLYCRLFSHLPSIKILAQDHFNDGNPNPNPKCFLILRVFYSHF
jgi:divalent metal cation (Fe/Co/Zn/Cd) transporter